MTDTLERQAATWAEKARVAVASRDKAIRALRRDGWSLRAIGEVVGLSYAGVAKICNRGT